MENNRNENAENNFIDVAVCTSSGCYPSDGFNRTPKHQKIRIELDKAAKELGLVGTNDWIARVDGNNIDVDLSFNDYAWTDKVEIDWSAREGGGGRNVK